MPNEYSEAITVDCDPTGHAAKHAVGFHEDDRVYAPETCSVLVSLKIRNGDERGIKTRSGGPI